MYKIYLYKDKNGIEPVAEYMRQLHRQGGKDARIKLGKMRDYVKILSLYGTMAGEPFVKHLDGSIWELRPLHDRILFAAWRGDGFVLLHQFMKKSQKTPKREIEKAKRESAELEGLDD